MRTTQCRNAVPGDSAQVKIFNPRTVKVDFVRVAKPLNLLRQATLGAVALVHERRNHCYARPTDRRRHGKGVRPANLLLILPVFAGPPNTCLLPDFSPLFPKVRAGEKGFRSPPRGRRS